MKTEAEAADAPAGCGTPRLPATGKTAKGQGTVRPCRFQGVRGPRTPCFWTSGLQNVREVAVSSHVVCGALLGQL